MYEREINQSLTREADIVVGIPSYNEVENISFVVEQVAKGLKKYFSDLKPAVINCDNNSADGTEDAFLKADVGVPKIYITTPKGVLGKGYNFENLFRKCNELEAKVVIALDADLKSITPEWIKKLGQAILDGNDYASPLYMRHKYDGTITNNVCFPIIYSLMGVNIRQPIGGDFAFSKRMYKAWLLRVWKRTTLEYGIDIFMSSHAILGDFKLCQVRLGTKIHKASAPKLGPMFRQVVRTLFSVINRNFDKWSGVKKITTPHIYGDETAGDIPDLDISVENVKQKAHDGFYKGRNNLEEHISQDVFQAIDETFKKKEYRIDSELWWKIVFELINAYRKNPYLTGLIEGFSGLYFSRVASFINDTIDMSNEEAEKEVVKQAKLFFDNRDYLIRLFKTSLKKKHSLN